MQLSFQFQVQIPNVVRNQIFLNQDTGQQRESEGTEKFYLTRFNSIITSQELFKIVPSRSNWINANCVNVCVGGRKSPIPLVSVSNTSIRIF